ncbi:hypothetical protein OROGR_015997 [Orobanche gracilis]
MFAAVGFVWDVVIPQNPETGWCGDLNKRPTGESAECSRQKKTANDKTLEKAKKEDRDYRNATLLRRVR